MFYTAIMESIVKFGISCWGATITSNDKKKITKLIKKSERIIQCELPNVDSLYEHSCVKKLECIVKDASHPLSDMFVRSIRSNRIIQPPARTERYRRSFVPASVRVMRGSNVLL